MKLGALHLYISVNTYRGLAYTLCEVYVSAEILCFYVGQLRPPKIVYAGSISILVV